MPSHHQILHFRAFGYVLLPGLLSPAEAATLRDEVSGALADAFGALSTEPNDLGGISGDYLRLAVDRAALSMSLIADDPRTFLASAELLGSPTVPTPGIATSFTGDSSWHTREGPDVGGVTFWADLEPRAADTGALRFIPGSRLPEFERRLWEYAAAEPAMSGFEHWEWPHVVVETRPGDVVAFTLTSGTARKVALRGCPGPSTTTGGRAWVTRSGWMRCAAWSWTMSSSATRITTGTAGRSGASGRPEPAACRPAGWRSNGCRCSARWSGSPASSSKIPGFKSG